MTFIWRIYYENGTTFSDTDGLPHESPEWGAIIVNDQGELLYGPNADYFLYRTDLERWGQVGETEVEGRVSVALVDHLAHFSHLISCVRCSRWIDDSAFKAICKVAVKDASGE